MSLLLCVCTGVASQVLSYVGDQLILNYTNGEVCHKIYNRSTEIYFSCHPDRHPVSFTHQPERQKTSRSYRRYFNGLLKNKLHYKFQ